MITANDTTDGRTDRQTMTILLKSGNKKLKSFLFQPFVVVSFLVCYEFHLANMINGQPEKKSKVVYIQFYFGKISSRQKLKTIHSRFSSESLKCLKFKFKMQMLEY